MKCTAVFFCIVLCVSPLFAADPIEFSANRMRGSTGGKSKTTILEGGAVVKAGSLELSGDRIEISGTDYRNIRATGNVTGTDTANGFFFSAREIRYDRELEYSVLEGGAVLEDTENNVVCRGGIIEYDKQNEIAVMQMNVRIFKDETVCRSAYAIYKRGSSELDLTGSPFVVRNDDEFKASRILVNLDTDEIVLEGRVSGSILQEEKEENAGQPGGEQPANVTGEAPVGDTPENAGGESADVAAPEQAEISEESQNNE